VEYLFMELIWYVAFAFAIGAVVGWMSCGRVRD
jgi:hypothetical protein